MNCGEVPLISFSDCVYVSPSWLCPSPVAFDIPPFYLTMPVLLAIKSISTCNSLQVSQFECEMFPHGIMFQHLLLDWRHWRDCGAFRRWRLITESGPQRLVICTIPHPVPLEFPLFPGPPAHDNQLPCVVTGHPAFPAMVD